MKSEYICDDRKSTPEYIQQIWDMTEEEFEAHIKEIKGNEE